MLRQNRFRVKLHAVELVGCLLKSHDRAGLVGRCHRQSYRQRFGIDNQRVVAAGNHWVGNSGKQTAAIMKHAAGAAVYRLVGTNDLGSEGRCNHLMAQADAQHRHSAAKGLHAGHRTTRLMRCAGTGRNHQSLRGQPFDFCNIHVVAGEHNGGHSEQMKITGEVKDKAVAVVEHNNHGIAPVPVAAALGEAPGVKGLSAG